MYRAESCGQTWGHEYSGQVWPSWRRAEMEWNGIDAFGAANAVRLGSSEQPSPPCGLVAISFLGSKSGNMVRNLRASWDWIAACLFWSSKFNLKNMISQYIIIISLNKKNNVHWKWTKGIYRCALTNRKFLIVLGNSWLSLFFELICPWDLFLTVNMLMWHLLTP